MVHLKISCRWRLDCLHLWPLAEPAHQSLKKLATMFCENVHGFAGKSAALAIWIFVWPDKERSSVQNTKQY